MFYREGLFDKCFAALEKAVEKYDALPYDEPAGYLMSPRQTYAALLAEVGGFTRAIEVYEADLKVFPSNVWSLTGLARCLKETGGKGLEGVEAARDKAAALADVKVGASCACALSHWKAGGSSCGKTEGVREEGGGTGGGGWPGVS